MTDPFTAWLWARNRKNIGQLHALGNPVGVYVLCDGSMPVYIGKGYLYDRIKTHNQSKTKKNYWDHFSWFAIAQPKLLNDVEALIIRMLPFYLRSLNKARPNFVKRGARIEEGNNVVDPPRNFPRFAPKAKKRKKR